MVTIATAKKLPSGMWRIQPFKVVNGKRTRASFTAATKREAERMAALWESDKIVEDNKNESLRDVLTEFIQTCKAQGYSPATVKEYCARIRTSYPDLIDKKFSTITTADVQRQIDKRSSTVKPKTIRNDVSFLRAATANRPKNIDFKVLKIATRKKRRKIEMKQEWKTAILLKLAEWYGKDEYYLYILLIIYAGLRPSESYALIWSDISKEPTILQGIKIGFINISKAVVSSEKNEYEEKSPKTDSGIRKVTVSWLVIEEILSVKPRGKDDERILERKPVDMFRRWDRIKKEFNLPEGMRRYDLRHFFATSLVISGATEEELQQQMGHSTSSFSHSIYVEIMQEHKEITASKFAESSEKSLNELKKISDVPD